MQREGKRERESSNPFSFQNKFKYKPSVFQNLFIENISSDSSPIQTTNKYLEKGRKKIILEGNEAKTHRTGRRLSGVMGNAADNRRYRSP